MPGVVGAEQEIVAQREQVEQVVGARDRPQPQEIRERQIPVVAVVGEQRTLLVEQEVPESLSLNIPIL
jgi:hypothetical protein